VASNSECMPRSVTIFVAALGAAGAILSGATWAWFGARTLPSVPVAGLFLGLLLTAEFLMVRFQHTRQVEALDLFEAVLAPAIFAFGGIVVACIVIASKVVVETIRRNHPVKGAFNVASFALMASVASLTFDALRSGTTPSAHNLAALVVAMVAMFLVNKAALVAVIHLAEGAPVRKILAGMVPIIVPGWLAGWGVNVAFGLLFVLAYAWSPAALLLAVVPLVTLHLAYRGYATALADQARLDGLHRATGVLSGPIDSREAIPGFLEEVRSAFACDAAELVLVSGDSLLTHRARDGRPVPSVASVTKEDEITIGAALLESGKSERITSSSSNRDVVELLGREGYRDCMAAPILDSGHVIGLLITYDHRGPEGFEAGALAILEALASEVAAALKKSELLEAILSERRRMAEIVTQTSDGIFTVGRGGIVLTWNPAMAEISGLTADAMMGAKGLDLLQAKTAEGVSVPLESLVTMAESMPVKMQITTRAGEARWLACSYSPVREPDGRIGAIVVVARDVTRAHEIEELKDDFIATVSHELRTPLTPIKGWAATLEHLGDNLDSAGRKEIAQSIQRQADRLERLVNNLLEAAQIERRPIDVSDSVVDAKALATRLVSECRDSHPGREIRLTAPVGPARGRGDQTSTEQILENLMSNALKYSPADQPIDVVIRQLPGLTEITVTDRGPGIAASDIERIFQRFQRVGHHMTREKEGAGLGLYIARRLADSMGASLSVSTSPGAGATFALTLRSVPTLVAVG
jgi:PAS domain S-box-containing protein